MPQHTGLYLYHNLSPYTQLEMKLYFSKYYLENGRYSIHHTLGYATDISIKILKHFKCFFSSVDPAINPPSQYSHPKCKVRPFLKHVVHVPQEVNLLGINISCGDKTIGLQGDHRDFSFVFHL